MRGRKPTPIEMKKLRNNPGCRKLPEELPVEKIQNYMPAPEHVAAQKYGSEVWDKTMPYLLELGILGTNDLDMLALYCVAAAIHKAASIELSQTGTTYESVNEWGGVIVRKHPLVEIANQNATLAHKFAAEFGLTPSARARLNLKPKTSNPLDKFLGNGSKAH